MYKQLFSAMEKKGIIRFDWAIKRLLRNKANHAVLEGFLSVLLKQELKIITICESESNKSDAVGKFNRVDIFVEDSRGELIIIELQNNYEVDYYYRMLFGVSKAITEYMKEGDPYRMVRKVYHINIIYFKLGEGNDYVYHGFTEFRGIHSNQVLELTREQKKFFVQEKVADLFPEYYVLCVKNFDIAAKDSLDEWIYYLKNSEIPDNFTAAGLKEAREQLRYDHLTEKEKREYRAHINQQVYEQSSLDSAYYSGRFEGEADGMEMGLFEGEAIGLKKGKTTITLNLFKRGMSVEDIGDVTGLSKGQVDELIKKHV